MTDTDTMLAIGIMEDIWHEMGAEIVQWTINNTDFWENDLIYPYMNEDKDPADINWDEIFYNFLDRFKTDAATDEEYIQIDRVVYGEVGFLLDTEHMGGHKYMSGRVGVSDTAMTSWTYSNIWVRFLDIRGLVVKKESTTIELLLMGKYHLTMWIGLQQ